MKKRIPANEIVDGTIIGILPKKVFEQYLPLWIDTEINVKVEKLMKRLCPYYNELFRIAEKNNIFLKKFASEIGIYTKVKALVPIDMSINGEVYVSNDHFSYNFECNKYNKKGSVGLGNIYDNKPKDGTIIGKATPEEIAVNKELDIKFATLGRLSDQILAQVKFADFKEIFNMVEELERKRMDFWVPIYQRLNAHWEWKLFVDYKDGSIYVQNYDLPYHDEKDEDEDE